jgi:hypothetical protein
MSRTILFGRADFRTTESEPNLSSQRFSCVFDDSIEAVNVGAELQLRYGFLAGESEGRVEKLVLKRRYRAGTGFVESAKSRHGGVPVLTSKRTATRAVPTKSFCFRSNAARHFFNSP